MFLKKVRSGWLSSLWFSSLPPSCEFSYPCWLRTLPPTAVSVASNLMRARQ